MLSLAFIMLSIFLSLGDFIKLLFKISSWSLMIIPAISSTVPGTSSSSVLALNYCFSFTSLPFNSFSIEVIIFAYPSCHFFCLHTRLIQVTCGPSFDGCSLSYMLYLFLLLGLFANIWSTSGFHTCLLKIFGIPVYVILLIWLFIIFI